MKENKMTAMVQPAPFWDKIAEKYAKSPIADVPTYEHTMARTRAFLKPTDRVLELGCGTGSTALLLAPSVAQITGTDISGEMVRIANGKAADQGAQKVTFEQAASDADAFPAQSFDAVLGYNLLHLLEAPMRTVLRALSLLKPGGVFITKTPCLGDSSFVLRLVIPVMQMLGKAPFVGFPTAEGLETMLRKAGFEVIASETHGKARNRFLVAQKL
ncbi:MAG: class I SAM-dependent methyltransferase [Pseudomonadota bacterium]